MARSSSDLPPGFAMAAPVPAPVDPLDDPEHQGCLEQELEALVEDADMDVLLRNNLGEIMQGARVTRDDADRD